MVTLCELLAPGCCCPLPASLTAVCHCLEQAVPGPQVTPHTASAKPWHAVSQVLMRQISVFPPSICSQPLPQHPSRPIVRGTASRTARRTVTSRSAATAAAKELVGIGIAVRFGQRPANGRQASLFEVGAVIDFCHSDRNAIRERLARNAAASVPRQRHVHRLANRREVGQIERRSRNAGVPRRRLRRRGRRRRRANRSPFSSEPCAHQVPCSRS